jgi:TolB-like protein/lipoprotein NlpI
LPFTNGSNDVNVEYLSDGITESIINSLSHLPGLRVMARTTTFRYKGRDVDPQAIGRDLKVRAILTGKVLQRGDALIIQADLVNVEDGAQLWGAQYNRKLSDILSVQAEISREIIEKLRLRLTNEEQERVAKQHTENIEAYQAYLKGRYYWNRRTVADMLRAIEHFNRAIALDPGYALAYSGLADCYHTLSNLWLPPTEAIPLARKAAQEALELDDRLASARASLAVGTWRFDWDWKSAEEGFKRAIELDPNYPPAHQWYGQLLTYQKKFDEGMIELKRAQQLDPLSLVINANIGLPLYFSGQYDASIEQFQRALDLDRNFPFAHFFIGWAYEQKRDYDSALAEFNKAVELDPTPSAWSYLGHGHAVSGRRREAEKIIGTLLELSKHRYVSPYYIAIVYAGLDEKELALDWLTKGVEDHSDPMVLINVEPKFDGLRNSPRFLEISRRVGFEK